MLGRVLRRQGATAGVTDDIERAVLRADHGPEFPVGHTEVGVVATGGDAIADADLLPRRGELPTGDRTGGNAELASDPVDLRNLLARVGDHQVTVRGARREHSGPLDAAGVHDHKTSADELVEHLTSSLTTAHLQRQVGVLRIGERRTPSSSTTRSGA
ncbi:hypothetical protein [Nocardioides sp. URHA0020]|uniref:hypothetical protein n=1 Tax=Nocardioides sp. URHA0020 TaxID=1380392 RepID=UPI001E5F4F54|nr:hypothetical protein [Nocardioides sp. URHA0020]